MPALRSTERTGPVSPPSRHVGRARGGPCFARVMPDPSNRSILFMPTEHESTLPRPVGRAMALTLERRERNFLADLEDVDDE